MSQSLKEVKFDSPRTAFVMITCHSGSERQIIDELRTIDGILEVKGTIGAYDIVTKLDTLRVESLRTIISKIRRIPEIRATTAVVCE